MAQHMLSNMRDHLVAITEILRGLGNGEFQRASEVAEGRIGLSSLDAHGAAHMAPYMPKAMQDIGTQMHRAASRFALVAQERLARTGIPPKPSARYQRSLNSVLLVMRPTELTERPNPAVNRTRRFMACTWRASCRRAGYLTR